MCNDLRETLTRLYEQEGKNEGEYKRTSKQYYDKKPKNITFLKGDMVLLHAPFLTGKLTSIQDSHYEVKGPNEIVWDGVMLNAFNCFISSICYDNVLLTTRGKHTESAH